MGTVTWEPAPTPAELLADAQSVAVRRVNDAYREQVAPLVSEYPEEEARGWIRQEIEARDYLAWYDGGQQGTAPKPRVLDRILVGRNGTDGTETLYELCQRVVINADAFIAAQELTGKRQRLVKQIRAATTVAEADAITW